ncbi:hypothetical protein AIIKEEIJ_06386 [Rhodococcus sp. YH1]|nr:hypothetical protein [Rhodococcus sp. YH1]NCL78875.1 hypothetical protein [Rhodococcus sp. YH1]
MKTEGARPPRENPGIRVMATSRLVAPPWVLSMETGKRPLLVSVGSASILAVLTAVRFVMMVRLLEPEQYGLLNLLTTVSSLLPMVVILGIPLHLQKIVRNSGTQYIHFGIIRGLTACGLTFLPTVVGLYAVLRPFVKSSTELAISAFAVAIVCHGIGCAIFSSQLLLGAGYRATAAASLLWVNSALTWTMCIPYLMNWSSVPAILISWAAGCFLSAGLVMAGAWRLSDRTGPDARVNSLPPVYGRPRRLFLDGIRTIPTLVGPWLLVFVVRYLLGLNLGETAMAEFSISSTVIESAFTVAVTVITFSANRLLDGATRPLGPFLWSTASLLAVSIPALILLPTVLGEFANDGYSFSIEISLVLLLGAIARLYLSSWRQRSLAVGTLGALSTQFIAVTAIAAMFIAISRPSETIVYALVQTTSYLVIAASQQWFTSRREGRSVPVHNGAPRALRMGASSRASWGGK